MCSANRSRHITLHREINFRMLKQMVSITTTLISKDQAVDTSMLLQVGTTLCKLPVQRNATDETKRIMNFRHSYFYIPTFHPNLQRSN